MGCEYVRKRVGGVLVPCLAFTPPEPSFSQQNSTEFLPTEATLRDGGRTISIHFVSPVDRRGPWRECGGHLRDKEGRKPGIFLSRFLWEGLLILGPCQGN